jgi:hypothetical protein
MKEPLQPEERVFGTLRNLQKIAETEDLNANRARILHMLDRALSWEGQIISIDASSNIENASPSV